MLLGIGFRSSYLPVSSESTREVGIILSEPRVWRAEQLKTGEITASEGSSMHRQAQSAVEQVPSFSSDPVVSVSNGEPVSILPGGLDSVGFGLPEIQLPTDQVSPGMPGDVVVDRLLSGVRSGRAILSGLDDEAILAEEAARRAAREARGPPIRISIFGSAAATGHRFVFAIDRSGSMGADGLNVLDAARSELTRALAPLLPVHSFQVVAYNHQCVYMERPRLLPATEENKAAVAPFLDSLGAFGGSGHEMALRAALAMEPDVVFLLSDGGDPSLSDIELTNLRRLAAGRTSIHCIRFGFGPAGEEPLFMEQLTAQNSGTYTYVDMSKYQETGKGTTVFGVN